jgi:hypothetical protein
LHQGGRDELPDFDRGDGRKAHHSEAERVSGIFREVPEAMNMEFFKLYLMALVGTPYRIGGDDPILGFDCSGLAGEVMRSVGALPHGPKMNAQQLADLFGAKGKVGEYGIGALSFYGADMKHITHVGVCLDDELMIEAGGGHADTTTLEKAADTNAFVKMRPIRYRKDFLTVIRPYFPKGIKA